MERGSPVPAPDQELELALQSLRGYRERGAPAFADSVVAQDEYVGHPPSSPAKRIEADGGRMPDDATLTKCKLPPHSLLVCPRVRGTQEEATEERWGNALSAASRRSNGASGRARQRRVRRCSLSPWPR